MQANKGFTLIELTIVVAVIGILVAIAIPDFMKFQAKSKQTEVKVIIAAIASSELQYKLQHGVFVACPLNPPKPMSPWVDDMEGWKRLGFGLDSSATTYLYEVSANESGFVVRARGNVDADETLDEWEITSQHLTPVNIVNDVNM